jgi:hypothetical protein
MTGKQKVKIGERNLGGVKPFIKLFSLTVNQYTMKHNQ